MLCLNRRLALRLSPEASSLGDACQKRERRVGDGFCLEAWSPINLQVLKSSYSYHVRDRRGNVGCGYLEEVIGYLVLASSWRGLCLPIKDVNGVELRGW